ncbi:metal-dependent hydrolase [Phenylobacterium sp.]|uniref:metal-dependent hydrolase n=1 Tax=Phenylobacterium sp. TaxID=1871053 RepID=UPI0035B2EC5E
MSTTATPRDLQITPRDLAFGRGQESERWWHGGDPVATAFYNALSLTFPQGEAYFVQSVRHFLDQAPEPLRGQIADFTQQEAFHSREHMAFNRQVAAAGYETRRIDELIREDIRQTKHEPPEVHVAATAALEHFTAMLAHAWLADERHFEGCPEEIRRLWRWHSVEEIEHKGVAFDTFMHATRELPAYKRWFFRVAVMAQVTRDFWKERKRDIGLLFQQDGIDTPKTWRRLTAYLFLRPGLLRQVFLPYLTYYLPGFHPWRHDDRELAARVERALGLDAAGQPA